MILKERSNFRLLICSFLWTSVFILPTFSVPVAELNFFPEPAPPVVDLGDADTISRQHMSKAVLPIEEWTLHKTSDDQHPDGNEQQLLWLMNRARSNPAQEGYWLAHTGVSDVESAVSYFGVNATVLQIEFNEYETKPPAAFDVRLYNAANTHSQDLISRNTQDHNGQFELIDTAGFHYWAAAGNVFSYMKNALYGHAAFNIDWGNDGGDGTGMQDGRGHRMAIMSVERDYTNVGLAVVMENIPSTPVGPFVTTGNFCFQYGTTTQYGSSTTFETVSSDSVVTAVISELAADTTYHFRLVATNSEGTSVGIGRTFQTDSSSAPTAGSSGGNGGGCFIVTTQMD
jgi:hypothetical protein